MTEMVLVKETPVLRADGHDLDGVKRNAELWSRTARHVEIVTTSTGWLLRGYWVASTEQTEDSSTGSTEVGGSGVPDYETSGMGATVAATARSLIQSGTKGLHCWDWCEKVYAAAGARRRQIWPDDLSSIVQKNPSKDYRSFPGYSRAEQIERLTSIGRGDWLFINNRNRYDTYGNHSVIFIEWKSTAEAYVAQLPAGNTRPPNLATYNLLDMPVTHISHPVPKSGTAVTVLPPGGHDIGSPGSSGGPKQPISARSYSPQMVAIGKTMESYRRLRYRPEGELITNTDTIGYGHLMTPQEHASGKITIAGRVVDITQGIGEPDAATLFGQDADSHKSRFVSRHVPADTQITQAQFDGLLSFVLNTGGLGWVVRSGLYRDVVAGNWKAVADFIRTHGTRSGGGELPGLVARRKFEGDIIEFGKSQGNYHVNGRPTALTAHSYDEANN